MNAEANLLRCPVCDGEGKTLPKYHIQVFGSGWETCRTCDGTGAVWVVAPSVEPARSVTAPSSRTENKVREPYFTSDIETNQITYIEFLRLDWEARLEYIIRLLRGAALREVRAPIIRRTARDEVMPFSIALEMALEVADHYVPRRRDGS